jgi:hypothetical protein
MQARYRSDYPGEFIVLETKWSGGKKQQTREWIDNPIENHHISGRAACIASKTDIERFDHTLLQKHRGGLLGSKKLQTYGATAIAQDMRLDFVVETEKEQLQDLITQEYYKDNIVYTTARNCLEYPGLFYLIPNRPHLLNIALLLYLAAFDGHKEIFLLGYNKDTPCEHPRWTEQVTEIFTTYPGIKFYLAGESTNMPALWLDQSNVTTMTYRDFIGYCDV